MKSTYDHVTFGEARILSYGGTIQSRPHLKSSAINQILFCGYHSSMKCFIIDVCVPLDENIHAREKEKNDKYTQFKVALLRLYPSYEYNIVQIVLGAMGLVTSSLVENLET